MVEISSASLARLLAMAKPWISSHFSPDHMGAEELTGFHVENGLDQTFGVNEHDRLAVGLIGEAADIDGVPRGLLGEAKPSQHGHRVLDEGLERASSSAPSAPSNTQVMDG
jgi:hypothetical protein